MKRLLFLLFLLPVFAFTNKPTDTLAIDHVFISNPYNGQVDVQVSYNSVNYNRTIWVDFTQSSTGGLHRVYYATIPANTFSVSFYVGSGLPNSQVTSSSVGYHFD